MGKRKKGRHSHNTGNMQRPYKRIDVFKKTFNLNPWQETLARKLNQADNTSNLNGDMIDSSQVQLNIDSSQGQLNFDANSNTIAFNVLKNGLDSLSTKYSGSAKMFFDKKSFMMLDSESKDIESGYIVDTEYMAQYLLNKYTVPPDFKGNVEFNQNALNRIASAIGLPGSLLYTFNQSPTTQFEVYKDVIPSVTDTEDPPSYYGIIPPVYIDKDRDWFAYTHNGNILPPKYEAYTEIQVTEEYQGLRRIWDPDGPLWLDKHHDFEEISTAMHLHPKLINEIGSIKDQNKVNDILHKMRYLLYKNDQHIFQRSTLHFSPTNELFQAYNALVRNKAVALDNPEENQNYIENLDLEIEHLFAKQGFEHLDFEEKMLGIALGARNIIATHKKGWPKIALLDFDFMAYPITLKSKYLNMPNEIINEMNRYPEEFFSEEITYLLAFINNIVSGQVGFKSNSLVFLNYKEWIIDMIRYLSEMSQYEQTKNQEMLPILYPVPMRLMLDYRFNIDAFIRGKNIHFVRDLIPAEIIDKKLIKNHRLKETYINYLWNNVASLELVRSMPFRNELAPQLWDDAYYSSVLEPVWYIGFKPNKANIDIKARVDIVSMFMHTFALTIISGQRRYSSGIGIARKEYEGDVARFGWYVGFLDRDDPYI